jgi:hypothetical protein
MVAFWRDTLRMGGGDLESAPVFAAEVVVEDRPYTDLLTATAGTCPSFDEGSGAFTPGDCANGAPVHAGLLSHPGVMKQFTSNLAFRRVRWVQETFDCTAFPAEVIAAQDIGAAAVYTSPWQLDSIAGTANGGRVNFLDTSSVICANCHSTMNHIAPLFGHFDRDGMWMEGFAVTLPIDGLPTAMLSDWLPAGQTTAWRFGVAAPDLPGLGAAMAADPAIAECAVARSWNWAFGKGDIVNTLAVVPSEVIAQQVADFRAGGFRLKPLLRAVFTADDFVLY